MSRFVIFLILTITLVTVTSPASAQGQLVHLTRLKHNNPGLIVDLGVGLWGQPLPLDYDDDGQIDLLMGWDRRPPGINLYKRMGAGPKAIEFDAGTLISDYSRGLGLQTSFSNGQWWVTSDDGRLYPKFTKTGIKDPIRLLKKNVDFGRSFRVWRYYDYDADDTPDLLISAQRASGRGTAFYWVRNTGTALEPVFGEAQQIMIGDEPMPVGGGAPNFIDFDGDGLRDIIRTEGLDTMMFFKNVGTEKKPRFAPGKLLSYQGQVIHMDLEMINPTAADYDGDGDVDLLVGEEDGRVSLLENTGESADGVPAFKPPVFLRQQADELKFGVLPTPCAYDLDGDGDTDLVAGNSAGYIGFIENLGGTPPKWAEPVYLAADGKVIRILAGEKGSIQGPGEAKWGYTTVSVCDWDLDKLPDLLVNSVWGKVVWFRNVGTRTEPKFADAGMVEVEWDGAAPKPPWTWWTPAKKELAPQWRTSVQGIDLTGDGLPDLVALDEDGYLAMFERVMTDGQLKLMPGKRVFHMEEGQNNVFQHKHEKVNRDTNKDGKNDLSGLDAQGRLGFFVRESGDDVKWIDRRDDPRYKDPGNITALRMNSGWAGRSGRRKFIFVDWDHDGRLDLLVNSVNVNFLKNVSDEPGKYVFRDMGSMDNLILAGHTTSPAVIDINGDGVDDLVLGAEDGFFYYLPNPWRR
jgi:hypothetical protein